MYVSKYDSDVSLDDKLFTWWLWIVEIKIETI